MLRGQVHDGVEDEVGECECPVDSGGREVADRHGYVLGARLRSQLRDHLRRQVDAVHVDAVQAEGQRDAARADAELERGAGSCQIGEEAHRRFEDSRIEPVRRVRVVLLGAGVEVTPWHSVATVLVGRAVATRWGLRADRRRHDDPSQVGGADTQ